MASFSFPSTSPSLRGFRLAVVGGGVLGLSIAGLAARAWARVTVFEPRALGDNASGVAAGMLSPGLEAALDPQEANAALLAQGYSAWPDFAAALRVAAPPQLRAGALYVDGSGGLDRVEARLEALGAQPVRLGAAAARALQPALAGGATTEVLHMREDGRVDPTDMLARLAAALHDAGGEVAPVACETPPSGFDAVVLAAGYKARRWIAHAPELAALQPIKGHVLHFQGGAGSGPTLRGPHGYAAPQRRGVIFGATMEPGRDDLDLDPEAVARLHAAALRLAPSLGGVGYAARTGVRAAVASGRPLVGRSQSGVLLAVGARRNGWLLAPLVAAAVVEALAGGAQRPEFSLAAAP